MPNVTGLAIAKKMMCKKKPGNAIIGIITAAISSMSFGFKLQVSLIDNNQKVNNSFEPKIYLI